MKLNGTMNFVMAAPTSFPRPSSMIVPAPCLGAIIGWLGVTMRSISLKRDFIRGKNAPLHLCALM